MRANAHKTRLFGALLASLLAFGGCRFGVFGLPGDGGGTLEDGGAPDDALDAAVGDLPPPPDLFSPPDGLFPGEVGWPCNLASECDTGFCISGVCCEELCDAMDPAKRCKACNVPGFEGRCVNVLDGTDPRDQCAEEPASTCGRDGLCNGAGACRLWGAGTQCMPGSCANDLQTHPGACNGLGNCLPGNVVSCGPYTCGNALGCATTCSPSQPCATGFACVNGSCGKRPDGQPCQQPADCVSNACSQGVCCNVACTANCFACNLPGTVGQCTAVPAGMDPLSQCAAETRASCGRDGTCNGLGGCRLWPAGTPCAGPSCMGDDRLSARTCDGAGTCQMGTISDCGKYNCNSANGTCYTSCNRDAHCAVGFMCKPQNGKCM